MIQRAFYRLSQFQACRLFLPPHCHINGLCPHIPAEWEMLRNQTSTYRLWLVFARDFA